MKVAVLGCGNMGSAIISGLIKNGHTIIAYDTSVEMRKRVDSNVSIIDSKDWFVDNELEIDAVILAVKPQVMTDVISQFKDVKTDTLWISIAAGISIETLESGLPKYSLVCRVMPNTPALIGEGASAYSLNSNCSDKEIKIVEEVLKSLGKFVFVQEKLMNAVTGISGSGPAYVFLFIESMIEAGVTQGLSREVATILATQTVKGAAALVESSGEEPSVLKGRVMSPGGTTAAALSKLEENRFKYSLLSAVDACVKRGEELG